MIFSPGTNWPFFFIFWRKIFIDLYHSFLKIWSHLLKTYSLTIAWPCHPHQKLIDHNASEWLNSMPSHFSIFVLASVPQCLNYRHSVVSFDMWKSGSTNFSLSCFYCSRFLEFPNKLWDHLVNFHISFILEPAQWKAVCHWQDYLEYW